MKVKEPSETPRKPKIRCGQRVYGGFSGGITCSRWAVVNEPDMHSGQMTPFCYQHAPSNVRARRKAIEERVTREWNERQAAERHRQNVLAAKEGVLVAVGTHAQDCPNPVRAAYLKLEKALAGRPS